MADDRVVTHDGKSLLAELDRVELRFPGEQGIQELGLRLHASVGMAVAELVGEEVVQDLLVRRDHHPAENLDPLSDGRLVGGLRRGWRCESCKGERPGEDQAREMHSWFLQ